MTRTKLEWPQRPRRLLHPTLGRRLVWKCRTDAYLIARNMTYLPGEFCLQYPAWARKLPTRHRTLKAAMRAAEEHRNDLG